MKKIIAISIVCIFLLTSINCISALNIDNIKENISDNITTKNKIVYKKGNNIELYQLNPDIEKTSIDGPDLLFSIANVGWGYRITNNVKQNTITIKWMVENVGKTYDRGSVIHDYWVYFYVNKDKEPIFRLNQDTFFNPTKWERGCSIGGGRYFYLDEKPESIRIVADYKDAIPETNEDNNEVILENIPDCAIVKGTVYKKINGELEPAENAAIYSTVGVYTNENGRYDAMIIPKSPYHERNTYRISGQYKDKSLEKRTDPVKAGETTNLDFIASQKPNKPLDPVGETRLQYGKEYTYSTSATDDDGDKLYYQWHWDDGEKTDWLGPYRSGETCKASHTWSKSKRYVIQVTVRDEGGVVNLERGYLNIAVSRDKTRFFLCNLLDEFLKFFFDYPLN